MYRPHPIDTSAITLPREVQLLTERLAEHAHDVWAAQRMAQGWTLGARRDDAKKTHPSLVPYADLPDAEKDLDRAEVVGTLKAVLACGYRIVPPDGADD